MNQTLTVDASTVVYSFSAAHQPRGILPLGQPVWIETQDCYGNRLLAEHTGPAIQLTGINPVSGLFAIEGVKAGDTLIVEILDIITAACGTMNIRPQAGLFGTLLAHAEVRRIPVADGKVLLPGGMRLPAQPMIGVLGTAPAAGDIASGWPGRHGGNMDTRLVAAGATVYLPAAVDGALFGLGDLHTVMGDGESGVCGVETAGRVLVRFSLAKQKQEPWPLLENERVWSMIASGDSLDKAAREAGWAMLAFLEARTGLRRHDLVRLLSVAGHLQISQVVNPLKTVRMTLAKSALQPYTIQF